MKTCVNTCQRRHLEAMWLALRRQHGVILDEAPTICHGPNQPVWQFCQMPPSLIHPGRNRAALKAKRDYLLDRLYKKGKIDKETFELSLLENLPEKPFPLPETATHLVGHLAFTLPENQFFTTIHSSLQNQIFEIVERHHKILESNKIHNIAALVLDTRSGEVLSYIGNTKKASPGGIMVTMLTSSNGRGVAAVC